MFALGLVLLSAAGGWPQAQCLSSNGAMACGFDCQSTYGNVACAETPLGRCVTTYGRVFCGDPSPAAIRAGAREPVGCVTSYGFGACGYDCKATNGNVACARTPLGRCLATNGRVFCGDPSPAALLAGATERVECLATNGTAACGYDCKATNGTVDCARTPLGRCTTTNGRVFCGDPAPQVLASEAAPPVACLTAYGTGACGYDCKASGASVGCAPVPWGRCTASAGRVTCWPQAMERRRWRDSSFCDRGSAPAGDGRCD